MLSNQVPSISLYPQTLVSTAYALTGLLTSLASLLSILELVAGGHFSSGQNLKLMQDLDSSRELSVFSEEIHM